MSRLVVILAIATILTGCANPSSPPPPRFPVAEVMAACPITQPPKPKVVGGSSAEAMEAIVVSAAPSRRARSFVAEAYSAAIQGKREEAIRFYELAVSYPDNDQPIDRVQWSYGWGMFALGDYQCALARFEAARQAAPDTVSWLPQTLAVVYWRMGERRTAVDWYDVAARNLASCWAAPKSAAYCTRHWRQHEQRALLEVNSAWRAQRFQP